MINEEKQKTMEFILEQQAQASSKINALALAQDRNEKKWEKTEEGIRAQLAVAQIHEGEIASLGQKIATVGEQIAEVSENGRATDERLNALINTVERQISEGRNGKP